MQVLSRLLFWAAAALASLTADVITKSFPHQDVVYNYAGAPTIALGALAVFLCYLGLTRSAVIAVGSGLMFGGLCGNAGQLLLIGYVTDWIPVGMWLTNIADLSGALGLLICYAGYVLRIRRPRNSTGRD